MVSPDSHAKRLGISFEALMKRRCRAEIRLVEAMRDGDLPADIEDLVVMMSSPVTCSVRH